MRISDWSSDVCSSDLVLQEGADLAVDKGGRGIGLGVAGRRAAQVVHVVVARGEIGQAGEHVRAVQVATVQVVHVMAQVVETTLDDVVAGVVEIGRASGRERVGQYV